MSRYNRTNSEGIIDMALVTHAGETAVDDGVACYTDPGRGMVYLGVKRDSTTADVWYKVGAGGLEGMVDSDGRIIASSLTENLKREFRQLHGHYDGSLKRFVWDL